MPAIVTLLAWRCLTASFCMVVIPAERLTVRRLSFKTVHVVAALVAALGGVAAAASALTWLLALPAVGLGR